MSTAKKFAGQTVIYGLSTILSRMIAFALTPFYSRALPVGGNGIFTAMYGYASIINAVLAFEPGETFYLLVFVAQILFYLLAILGLIMEKQHIRIKALFIPYYFCVMNYAVLMGIIRYFTKKQSAIWEKAQRKQ